MEWRNLSVKDRAGLIRQMVSLGITTSKEQEKFYNDSIANPNPIYNLYDSNYMFKNGGNIHIKESHKGLFTNKANNAGYGVQEYARHVLANKEDYPTSTIRQANFARNASKWKHSNGGPLDYSDDYDYEGFNNDTTMKVASNGHYSDKYKKPIHITFSEESKYSKNNNPNSPYQGGKWVYPPAWSNYNTKPMFVPSYTNKQFYTPQDYYDYSERTGESVLLSENLVW